MNAGLVVRAREAEALVRDPGSVITLLADPEHTGGTFTANRSLLKAGSAGAPPHSHSGSVEIFFVLGGVLEVLLGEELLTLETGDLLAVPPNTPHAFAPTADSDADLLVVFIPGKPRFDYYRLLDHFHAGEAQVADITASQDQFDNRYVDAPRWADRHA